MKAEAFRFVGNEFTRLRHAGGRQLFVGVFAEDTWNVSPAVRLVSGWRADRWQLSDGFRMERDRADGNRARGARFRDRAGFELNGRIGVSAQLNAPLTFPSAAYSGFRVPTLNELYRPFRVGNDVTEANPRLRPERLLGAERSLGGNLSRANSRARFRRQRGVATRREMARERAGPLPRPPV